MGQKIRFAKGGFRPRLSLFERLYRLGYEVEEEDRYFPFRAVFDYESIYVADEDMPVEFELELHFARSVE